MHRQLASLCVLLLLALIGNAQLSVDFSADKAGGCSPLVVQFTPLLNGPSANATYQWDLGNGNTATIATPQAIYNTIGTYTVTLTVSANGQTASASHPVTVYPPPTAAFSASAALVCSTPVTFTSASQPGSGSVLTGWLWDFGDGSTQQGGPSVAHSFPLPGTMTVSLTVTDDHGCTATALRPNIVQIFPKLDASFTADKQILCNVTDPVQFTNNSSGPGTITYSWDFGDGNTSSQFSPGHSYTQKGNYNVKLTATSSVGCVATATQPTPLNVANYSTDFDFPPAAICQNTSLAFTDKSQPTATSRNWSIDGTPVSPIDPFSYTFSVAGAHTITLANVFGTCPPQSVSKQILVNPTPPYTPFTTVFPSACGAPVTATLTANPIDNGVYTYDWHFIYAFGDGPTTEYNSGTDPNATHVFSANDQYTIQLTTTNSAGCQNNASRAIVISPPTVTIHEVAPGTPSRTCNTPVTKTLSWDPPSVPLQSWSWDFGDGASSTDVTPTHTWTQPGQYSAVLHWTNVSGCSGTSTNSILVVISPPLHIDFSTTPTTVCAGTMVSFASPSLITENVTNSNWDFGDGGFGGLPIHIYNTPGVFTVTLNAQNAGGCTATETKPQYITVLQPPGQYVGYTSTCDGTRNLVTFSYTQAGATSITWDFGDGTSLTTGGNVGQQTHSYARTGTYYINVSGTNGVCSNQNSDAVFVLLKQTPILSAESNTACTSGSLNVFLTIERNPREVNSGYYYDYTPQFFYGDGTPFNGTVVLTDPDNAYRNGAFEWTLAGFQVGKSGLYVSTKSFGFNCTDVSNTMPLVVRGSASAALTVANDNRCFSNPVQFNDASVIGPNNAITSWTWDFGDGTVQTTTTAGSFSHSYAHPGSYTARLTIQDQGGCVSSSSGVANVSVNGPEPSFSYSPTTVLLGNTVYFANQTNTYGAPGTSYTWDFGDGSSSSDPNPTHLYAAPGSYVVRMTATGGNGSTCTLTVPQTVVVKYFNSHFQTTPLYVSNGNCPPVLAKFSNTSTNYSSVAWDFGDGTGAGNINYPSHVYPNPGAYQVTLSVFGSGGLLAKYTDSVFVRQPSASLSAKTPAVCVNQPEQLQAKAKGALNFVFDYGDGAVSSGLDSGVNHVYAHSGNYTAQLVVTDTVGCSVAAATTVTVAVNPLPTVGISPVDPHLCLGSTIVLNASGGSSYSWVPAGDLDNPIAASPVASPSSNTTYVVTVTDDNGCQGQGTVNLRVVKPETLTVSPDSTGLCAGDSVVLHTKGTDVVRWIGDVSGLHSTVDANPVAQPPQTVHYQVVGSDADACFSDTAAITVTVLPLPTVNGGGNVEVLDGTPIALAGTGSDDIVKWEWSPAIYLSCTDCAQPVCTPKKPETYTATVTNGVGCQARDTVQVKLLCVEAHVRIADAFTPNGDGHNDRWTILGIGQVDHLVIFDRWGVKVFERNHFYTADADGQWDGTLHGQPAPAGVYAYFVEMSCPSGGTFMRRGTVVLIR